MRLHPSPWKNLSPEVKRIKNRNMNYNKKKLAKKRKEKKPSYSQNLFLIQKHFQSLIAFLFKF